MTGNMFTTLSKKGALMELSGPAGCGKTEVVIRFLSENPGFKTAWIESDFTIYPCAFFENKINPDRVLFVDTEFKDPIPTALQILRSGLFQLLVVSGFKSNEIILRRLQLAAKRSGASVILLSPSPIKEGNWPIYAQIKVRRSPETGKPVCNDASETNSMSFYCAGDRAS